LMQPVEDVGDRARVPVNTKRPEQSPMSTGQGSRAERFDLPDEPRRELNIGIQDGRKRPED
jgi:hypothetical protein